jgi:hypothetical protein
MSIDERRKTVNNTVGRMVSLRDFCLKEDVKTVLELGTDWGEGSTLAFLDAGCFVTTVDIDPRKDIGHDYLGCSDRVVRFICDDLNLPLAKTQKFDLVFIDTIHLCDQTKAEIELAKEHAKRFIAFDDMAIEDVKRAVTEAGLNAEIISKEEIPGGGIIGVHRIK